MFLLFKWVIFHNNKNSNNFIQEDLIFFKFFNLGNSKKENTENLLENTGTNENIENFETSRKTNKQTNTYKNKKIPQYHFNVKYKNIDFKEINLAQTIKKETLVNEKIAPRNKRRI